MRIVHSPFGLHLTAIRENPRKAEYLGVRVRMFRLAAFLISAFYCAIGGCDSGNQILAMPTPKPLTGHTQASWCSDSARRFRQLFGPLV